METLTFHWIIKEVGQEETHCGFTHMEENNENILKAIANIVIHCLIIQVAPVKSDKSRLALKIKSQDSTIIVTLV